MPIDLIIFDFDGVVADSEALACGVLASYSTELGAELSLEDSLSQFMGKRIQDVSAAIEKRVGRPIPGFGEELLSRQLATFRAELKEVRGLREFLDRHRSLRRCIASSSAPSRLRSSLEVLKLADYFEPNVFSAEQVKRGKPFPDIFLFAAEKMGVGVANVVVIEDSPSGVQAAVAAEMKVIGLLAGSHIKAGHEAVLRGAGADYVANTFDDISNLLSRL